MYLHSYTFLYRYLAGLIDASWHVPIQQIYDALMQCFKCLLDQKYQSIFDQD